MQFTNHFLPSLFDTLFTREDEVLEAAEEAFDNYVRNHSQLAKVIDYLIDEYIKVKQPVSVIKVLQLIKRYIEYHPKVISVNCKSFVNLISALQSLKNSPEIALVAEVTDIFDDFFGRFPATMKDITTKIHKRKEKQIIDDAKKLIKSSKTDHELSPKKLTINLDLKGRLSKNLNLRNPSRAGTEQISTNKDEKEHKLSILKLHKISPCTSEDEEEKKVESKSLIPLSDNGLAFNIFPQNTIQELLKSGATPKEKSKLLDVMLSFLRSSKNLIKTFHSSNSFLSFIIKLLSKGECIQKILEIIRILVRTKCIQSLDGLTMLFTNCIKFLGEDTFEIRQEAMRLFITMMKSMPSKSFVEQSLSNIISDNWRLKEEIVNLLIICMISDVDKSLDIDKTVESLASLVTDEHSKVRFVAREACAMFAKKGSTEKIMKKLGDTVVHNDYVKINEILEKNYMVTFNENKLMFEYPKKPKPMRKMKLTQAKIKMSGNSKIKINLSDTKNQSPILLKEESDYIESSKDVRRNANTIRNRKIKLRNNPSKATSLNMTAKRKPSDVTKVSSNYSDLLSPKSNGENSVSNYTDYMLNKKVSSSSSPDRLRILKETIRSNNIRGDGNKFLHVVQKRRGAGVSQRVNNNSVTQSSLYSINMKSRMEDSSDGQSQAHDSTYKGKFINGKKHDYSEYMNSAETPTRYESNAFSKKGVIDREKRNMTQFKLNSKKMNAAAEACINRLLGNDQEPEDEGKYLKKDDIKPLKNPDKVLKIVYKDLTSSDWQKQFDACNSLRALVLHHKDILVSDVYLLQGFIQGMVKQIESLRSSVSKNALIGFKDIAEVLKKRIDNDLDYLIPATMKKAVDKNVFLSKVATDLLISVTKSCSENKVMNVLGSLTFQKSPTVRVKMQIIIETVIKKLGYKLLKFKDNISIMGYLTSFLQDASEKVREKSKEVLDVIKETLGEKNLDKLIKNTCNDQQEKRIYRYFEGGNGGPMSEAAHSANYFNNKSIRKSKRGMTTQYFPSIHQNHAPIDDYALEEVPEVQKRRKMASVIKKHPKKLLL
ncbi:unnamed protein product [Moneuplotes crassus]|uniref:TOG domain-containing protein n=1 Tax=Euplotes crassus TaxID=5936 RepID=A0AAD1XGI4_EUPCR|nr:unnamed protein product [Moneuplotes crassus]